ncbi:nucleophile aminohydrolase [Aspergillus karnatakaensis]|uniref:nucleophile aminohydrolase n=1 Tax=Aspergillus karnatakaensis TaxID=1810916 RepID=UPI003CCDAF7C
MSKEAKFYPYTSNGGATLGLSGRTFALLAGDTRSTSGYNINTRSEPKVFTIQDAGKHSIIISVIGFAADGHALKEKLSAIVAMYKYQHGKPISLRACAQRVSTLLYEKRFFPYQLQTMVAGLDESGQGAVYYYDPAGCIEKRSHCAAGEASSLMLPFLDSQVPRLGEVSRETGEGLVKDAFGIAAERHIEVGDGLQMLVVTEEGVEERVVGLKRD